MSQQVIDKLRNRLQQPLPGIEAQKAMMPLASDTSRFNLSNHGNSIPGGVLILLYPYLGEIHIPLMLRPEYGGAHSGQVSFPGGRKEPDDQDLTRTALREANEELGIPDDRVKLIGNLTELYIIASNFRILPVIGYLDQRPDFIIDPREVEETIEMPVSLLLDPGIVKSRPFEVSSGFKIEAPYFDIKGYHVWGATAMILSEFLTVFKDL